MIPWRVIAHRSTGADTWDSLPSAAIDPDSVPSLEAAGHLVSRIRTAGRAQTLEVRECGRA